MAFGTGSHTTTLGINLLAPPGSPEQCGVLVNNVSINLRQKLLNPQPSYRY